MRRHYAEELARADHLGFLPERWKMPLVASHQVVGPGASAHSKTCRRRGLSQDGAGVPSTRVLMRSRSCSPLRVFNSGRASTSRYSARMASDTYNRAGFVNASRRTGAEGRPGLKAAETTRLVSMTTRSGI